MAMIECPECGRSISDTAQTCPGCGAPTPKKTRKRGLLIWVFLGLFGWIVFSMATPSSDDGRASAPQRAPAGFHVMYGVEAVAGSTNAASITYTNAQGGTEQVQVNLPWLQIYERVSPGTHLYVSAQNASSSGSLKVRILLDGQVVKESTSSGAYAIASASERCCSR